MSRGAGNSSLGDFLFCAAPLLPLIRVLRRDSAGWGAFFRSCGLGPRRDFLFPPPGGGFVFSSLYCFFLAGLLKLLVCAFALRRQIRFARRGQRSNVELSCCSRSLSSSLRRSLSSSALCSGRRIGHISSASPPLYHELWRPFGSAIHCERRTFFPHSLRDDCR